MERFKGLEIDTCPSANLPEAASGAMGRGTDRSEDAGMPRLKPVPVGLFAFPEWSGDNRPRHSRFIALRVRSC